MLMFSPLRRVKTITNPLDHFEGTNGLLVTIQTLTLSNDHGTLFKDQIIKEY